MPILRHAPGDVAPRGGTYVLVGHYGEATNVAMWIEAGNILPPVTMTADIGPLWYIRMDVANESTGIA